MRILCLLLLFFLTPSLGVTTGHENTDQQAHLVSLIQLIATPEKFDGQIVEVIGFLNLEFEGNELFVSREDYENGIAKNGVWIVRNPNINADFDELNRHYVALVGRFSASNKGHLSMTSGSIGEITDGTAWPPRNGVQR